MVVYVNGERVKSFDFPGGEVQVSLYRGIWHALEIEVTAWLYNPRDIMEMLLTVDAIRNVSKTTRIILKIPYLPYARQDRVCNQGESFSLRVMCNLINELKCDAVRCVDVHSGVASALLNNFDELTQTEIVYYHLGEKIVNTPLTLVCPDAGAEKKLMEIAKSISKSYVKGIEDIVFCRKIRDIHTGEILATEVYGNVQDKNVLIIDDICDGGRTFIEIAKVLSSQGVKSIQLYVTHGIFSNGFNELSQFFDHIYCYHTFIQEKDKPNFLTVFNNFNE